MGILALAEATDACHHKSVIIDVLSAESQVVAGMNYRVTVDIKCICAKKMITKYEVDNVVISYYMPLGAEEASNLEMIDNGTEVEMNEEESSDDDEEECKFARLFRLLKVVVPALLVIGICVIFACCLRKCKNKKPRTDKYSEMYEENDAIEAGL